MTSRWLSLLEAHIEKGILGLAAAGLLFMLWAYGINSPNKVKYQNGELGPRELAEAIKDASQCGLGQSLSNPVLSSLKHFKEEYEEHIKNKRCPAGVCKALISFSIDKETCTGCRLCAKKCPQDAITGEAKEPHIIDPEKCIKCGVCVDVCKFEAVSVT